MVEILHLSNLCVIALIFFYSLNFAPMMFESFTSDRIWGSNPPESFYMFRGRYGQKTAHYWRVVSPLAIVAFILSIVFNWSAFERERWLLIAFVLYVVIQIASMAYFVPEQETLIASADSLPPEALKSRADRWIFLNYFRNGAGALAYVFLLLAVLVPRASR